MISKLLLYLGAMLLVGGIFARHLLPGRPPLRWLLAGLVLLISGAAWSVHGVLAELDMLNLTDTLDYLTRVQAGRAVLFLLLGACLLLAAHLSRFSRLTEIGAAGLTLWGLAGIGHGVTHGEFVRFLHAVHAGAMSVWMGGVLALLMRPTAPTEGLQRFSPVAASCVFTLGLTGAVMTLNHAGSMLDLPQTPYGRLLLLKIITFLLVLLMALAVRLTLARRRFKLGWLLMEGILLLLVLGMTAALSQMPPPAHQIQMNINL